MTVIETFDLTKRFGKITAVDHVSFAVERGQVFGFLGPNGSGKTTTIGMLLGIITPSAGGFRLFGEDHRHLHHARQRMGATLEYPNFYPYLSGLDNLRIVANVKGVDGKAVAEALELVGLWDRRKSRFKTYSLGMKQRLALAATMLGDPELVILDEPANGLDPEGMREIREIIQRLGDQGRTIFLSSHLLWEVERTCSHVAIVKKGRVVRQGSVKDITSGNVYAGLASSDLGALERVVREYPGTVSARTDDGVVIAELRDDDLASLNRYVTGRDIWLSHLALRARSLEDAFMEATGAAADVEESAEPAMLGSEGGER